MMNPSTIPTSIRATLADLAKVPGKAELIGGKIVHFMATGFRPSRTAAQIFRSLDAYAEATGQGLAFTDNMGFAVAELSSGRESFSPDAAYYVGPVPDDLMDFIEGAPTLAVEVRSKGDYGPAAEREIAAKRADYFEAGTAAVWDVDLRAEVVMSYEAVSPNRPTTFIRGEIAAAESAVPGWRLAVDRIFD